MPILEGSQKGYSNNIPQSFAEDLVKKYRVTSVQSVPLRVGVKLEESDEDEETESWPFVNLLAV